MSRLALLGRRPWHVCLAAFGGGLVLAESTVGLVCAVAGCVAGVLVSSRAPQLAAPAAALLLAGAATGELRLAALDAPARRMDDGRHVVLRAHLLTLPRPNPFGSSAEVEVAAGDLRGSRLLVRAARWAPLPESAAVGAELRIEGRLRVLRPAGVGWGGAGSGEGGPARGEPGAAGPAEGGPAAGRTRAPPFDYATYLRGRGVAAELQLVRARVTGRRRGGVAGALDRMRERAERAVVAGMPATEAALLRGMVLGQDERVDSATRDDWRDAGLAHLLAVSGQNVMLLAALALPLLALAGLGLRGRLVAVAALTAIYVPLAGAGPSLQRAGVMGLAGIVAMAASRPASRWYALLLAAAATLAWNPRAWTDPGWQLSFAAVAGILTLGVPLGRALLRTLEAAGGETAPLRKALVEGIAITVAATLATAPLLAHHFGSVSTASLPANLLALPAVAPAMWLGMLKTALGQLATDALPAPLPDLAHAVAVALGAVAAPAVGYLAALGERFADMPGGQLAIPLRSPAAVGAAYAALGAAALGARLAATRLEPRLTGWTAAWAAAPRGRRRALAATLIATIALGTAAVMTGPAPPDRLTIRFLDVGQGDATLVQHPDGTAVLFDGGPPEAAVTRLLRRAGVKRLAAVVATHASRDHHGGLPAVLHRFEVDLLLDGGDGTPDPSFNELLRHAAAQHVRRVTAVAPLTLAAGGLRIDVLSPPPRPPGPAPEDPNPRAVVAIVSSGELDLLLSADAESDTLLPLDLPDVDVMKVAHHGSADPGLPQLLDQIDPELAAIEVGPNTYGHPAPSTLAALDHARVRTFRTDRHGTVTVTAEAGEMQVEAER